MKKVFCWFFCLVAATSFAEWTYYWDASMGGAANNQQGTLTDSESGIVLNVNYKPVNKTAQVNSMSNPNHATVLDLSEAICSTLWGTEELRQGITYWNVSTPDTYIQKIILPDSIGTIATLANWTALEEITPCFPPSLHTVGGSCFRGTKLKGVFKFCNPDTEGTIGTSAFQEMTGVTLIDMSESKITTCGNQAFYKMPDLGELRFSPYVKALKNSTCYQCPNLTNVTPRVFACLTDFGNGSTFCQCAKLKGKFTFSCAELTTVPARVFGNSGIEEMDFTGSSVTSMGTAFEYASGLGKVTLPNTIESLNATFQGCASLTNVTPLLPASVVCVDGAFNDCKVAGDLVISNPEFAFSTANAAKNSFSGCDLTSIDFTGVGDLYLPQYCFRGNAKLKKVVFPAGRITTGTHAMRDCPNVEEVYFRDPPSALSENDLFPYNIPPSFSAKFYIPKDSADWKSFLTTNSDGQVSWTTAALTPEQKASFAEKWPGEHIPTRSVTMTKDTTSHYLCYWWPNGAPGLMIILK